MRVLMLAILALGLTGCASATDIVKALAKDTGSACVVLDASLYGSGIYCRTNTPGAAVIRAGTGAVEIQHRGQ